MATKRLRPVHTGDILRHDFMEPLNLSAYRVAKDLNVSAPTVNEIVRRRKSVTAEMALRLARYFGTSAQLWLNLQTQYDLEIASQKTGKKIKRGSSNCSIRTKLELAGTPIGGNDLIIASQALTHELTLVTDNDKEFGRIDGLAVENWLRD